MLTEMVTDERAWRGDSLRLGAWIVPIPQACLDELARALVILRAHPLPMLLLKPITFRRSMTPQNFLPREIWTRCRY